MPPPQESGEEVGARIDEILSRPEFQEPPKSIVERVTDFLGELVGDVLGTLIGGGRGSLIGYVLLVLFIGALVVVWVRFVPSMRRDPSRTEPGARIDRPRPSAEWRAEADAHAQRGEWRDALRCRYRALVAALAERGLIDEVVGRTTGEYRHEVHQAVPAVAGEFTRATHLFELVWYGDHPAAADEHEQIVALSERVLESAS